VTSLFMGFISNAGVPADEKVVRNTATPVYMDKPAAMQEDMPQQGEIETDSDPNLGMDPRQLASKWNEGRVGSPAWIPTEAEQNESNQIINRQVSTSGTAAAREVAGIVNPNLSYAIGIEPVGDLTEGGQFSEVYFKTHDKQIQSTSGNEMSVPPGYDQSTTAQVAANGKNAARTASGALYAQYWNGGN
jgi:hypothetical protein